jgi:DnaK suppressor protein
MNIEEYKKKLLESEKILKEESEKLEKPTDMGDDVDSFEEEGDEAEQFGAQLGMDKPIKNRLARVREALTKIEQGKFGKCEKCDNDIEEAILEIDPESEFCKACKLKMREQ